METKQPIGETEENFPLAERVEKVIILILDTCEEMLCNDTGEISADKRREVIKILSAAVLPIYRIIRGAGVTRDGEPGVSHAFRERVERSVETILVYCNTENSRIAGATEGG